MSDALIPKFKKEIIKGTQNAKNIALQIRRAIRESEDAASTIASKFQGNSKYMSCFNVYNYLRQNVRYQREGENLQTAKTLQRILYDAKNGKGHDCKHYTIFSCSILRALNIPCEMRLISQNFYSAEPTHIYCVAYVNGKEIIVDSCMKTFNNEAQYKYKYNLKIK